MGIGGSTSLSKQTDLGFPQIGLLSITLFLVAIYIVLVELENRVDKSLFADNLTIDITTRNQKMAPRALQGVTNM